MLVSIIVPAHNAEATLARCIEACLAQSHAETEVIVVDDGSTDRTSEIAARFPVRFVGQQQAGPAAARNHGARVAQGELLAFTDADCIPALDWIARLVEAFEEGVVAAGGAYDIANRESLLARMVHEEIAARHARLGGAVDFVGSFNVAYRREAFDAAGGFDERFTQASGEDNDLAYRLQDQGGALRFTAAARVAHVHPSRLGRYLRSQMRHGYWRVLLYRKHPRRTRGDQYAGPADLVGPPVALLLAVGTAVWLLLQAPPAAGYVLAGLALVYLLTRLPIPVRMARNSRDPRMLLFTAVLVLRDLARGLGMLRGFAFGFPKQPRGQAAGG